LATITEAFAKPDNREDYGEDRLMEDHLFVVMTGMMQMVECVISDGVPEIMEELQ
jgi:hypothetical protein